MKATSTFRFRVSTFPILNNVVMLKMILLVLLGLTNVFVCLAQPRGEQPTTIFPKKLNNARLTEQFYQGNQQTLFWFREERGSLRERLVSLLDSSKYMALDKKAYHYDWLKNNIHFFSADTTDMSSADKVFTDAALSFCKDIYQGAGISGWVGYDELSPKAAAEDNSYILGGLASVSSANELDWFARFLEPASGEYIALKNELRMKIDSSKDQKIIQLGRTINHLRWIRHFGFEKYVVVNSSSAVVRYYECDTVKLRMKAVVGTPATPTPSFAGYCDAVVLYPYWHVPFSIAVNEILPIVKRNPSYLGRRGLQVINASGKVLDPYAVNWQSYSSRYFPLQFRQSTGCDNALGVIKFNLTDPYSVYMHDTNNKNAFFAGSRFFSHGCIRLEKPVELANEFLPGRIDTAFLEACHKDQKPVTIPLAEPIPVFVVYMTAEYDDDKVIRYLKDVYRLVK